MEQNKPNEPRPTNDSRVRTPVESGKVETVKPVESKPSLRQRWSAAQPNKTVLFWACVASVILTVVIGFNWGGWVTASAAQQSAETLARSAVVQRLAPICVAQFDQDPDKTQKLDEMNERASSQRVRYVQDQGWATIVGEESPNRSVADACAKLILEMNP